MDGPQLERLLDEVRTGTVDAAEAARRIGRLPFADLGFAKVDHHRALRQGMPEAVYAPGKTPAQCAGIVAELLSRGSGPVLLTRADGDQLAAAVAIAPPDRLTPEGGPEWHRTAVWRPAADRGRHVAIVTAGTSDLPVADECRATLGAYGIGTSLLADVGVAGLHRLLGSLDALDGAEAVVVAAGMEGALASVVGGLVACPVVAVPTSTGYGAALEGVTALLAMHASCAPGISVVGIDNGYGAACAVARMLR